MIGEILGSYRVLARIGEGGMGPIFLAEHPLLGRRVAVKMLLSELSPNPAALDGFFNEARIIARLRHPALVDLFDFGFHQASKCVYIIMELLEGDGLDELLKRTGRLGIAEAVDYARQIVEAVGIAHGAGIVHRDLKPRNIFLVADPWRANHRLIKILDLGMARLAVPGASPGSAGTGPAIGAQPYMAPEQCRDVGTIDVRADIYSIGCLLHAMVCGRGPFEYEFSDMPPRALEPSVPEELEAIILKALARKPAQRYQTTAEMAAALGRVPHSGGMAP